MASAPKTTRNLSSSRATSRAIDAKDVAPSRLKSDNLGTPPLHGRLVLQSMPLSNIVNRKITTWVYLPPGYDTSSTRYPVIYILHGQPGGWTDCYKSGRMQEMADALIASGQMEPVILAAFEANGPGGARDMTNFCNRATDGYRAEDFIIEDLVPYIDATYRTLPIASQRALLGYSGGGYGALNLGLKHQDIFNVLCSHAGFYQPSGDESVMKKVLGPRGPLWDANNPLLNAKKIAPSAPLHIFMDAAPGEEDFDDFVQMSGLLKARGVDLQTIIYPKAHTWRAVAQHCRESFLFADRSFAKGASAKGASQDKVQDEPVNAS